MTRSESVIHAPSLKMNATIKKFIKIFSGLSLGSVILASWFLYSSNLRHYDLVAERQLTVVKQVADAVTRGLYSNASDARFLSRLTGRYLESDHPNLRLLEDLYADFSRSREYYFSLSFIDTKGGEQIRVDRSYSGPVIAPETALRDLSDRYYFRETIKAGRNQVYVSRFDLNILNGRIEMPYRPTLRFGCPVLSSTGQTLGVIIISYEGRTLINRLRLNIDVGVGVLLLSNGNGDWIVGPTPDEEWGHLLGHDGKYGVDQRFPAVWQQMEAVNSAQFRNRQGLFSFETVGLTTGEVLYEKVDSGEDADKRWKVLTWVPDERLSVPWVILFLVAGGVFLALVAMGCWQVADNMVHQEEVENRLRENEERTMAISQSSQDAIVMIDSRGRIILWNPAAEKLFGYTEIEAMGTKLNELIAPEGLRGAAKAELEKFAETGKGPMIGNVLEFSARHKDGSEVPIELAASSFQFKGEWYAVGSMRDISRRRIGEMDLKRSEETSRALINAPTESAMLIGINGIIEAINEVGARRIGSTVERLVGENAFDHMSEDFANRGPGLIAQVQRTGRPVAYEDQRGDRRMLINIYPVRGADETIDRLAVFGRDVTEQRRAEAALMHSEQRFRDVSEAIGEVIWETDAEGLLKFITQDVEVFAHLPAEQLIGKPMSAILPEEDVDDFNHWRNIVYARQEPFSNVEARTMGKDGSVIWLQINGTPYFDAAGRFQGYRGAAMDITERKATETAIKASERKLRALAESAYDAIVMIDSRDRVSFWNDAAEQLFGYTEQEVLGQAIHPLITPPEELEHALKGMERFSSHGMGDAVGSITEVMAMRKDGSRFEAERSIASFRLEGAWYAVATIRDISERKATEAKLLELATTDSLTGLYNRRRFMELCEREFSRSIRYDRPLAMFMMDIDHFKKVNDEYGHDAGDRVLRALSEISVMALRNADLLGRLGGEEFGVLLPETDAESALDVAERLRQSISRTDISVNSHTLKITVSIGISMLTPGMHSIDTLLKGADIALYEAKQTGRNRVVVYGSEEE